MASDKAMKEAEAHFERLGLTRAGLGEQTFEQINLICKCAAKLGIKDVSSSSFYVAWTSLLLQKAELEKELECMHAFNAYWKKKVEKAEAYQKTLLETKETLKDVIISSAPEILKKYPEISMFGSKSKDYEVNLHRLQRKLKDVGYTDQLNHSTICKQRSEYEKLKEELRQLTLDVESYANLPPDLPMARLKVAKMEKELEELKKKLVDVALD